MTAWRFTRHLLMVSGIISAASCYAYVPVATAPKAGERVRLALSPQGTVELTRFLGPGVVEVEGPLSSTAPSGAMMVAVDFVRMSNGTRQPWNGEGVVSIPPEYVVDMRERTFQRGKSIVAGTGLTVALIATAVAALRIAGAGGSGSGGPPPPPP